MTQYVPNQGCPRFVQWEPAVYEWRSTYGYQPTAGQCRQMQAAKKRMFFQMAWFVTVMSAPIWKLIAYFALWISAVPSKGVMAAVDLRLQSAEPKYWQANAPMLEVSVKHHRATGAFMRNVRTNSQSIERSTVFRSGGTDWRSVPVKHTHHPHPYSKAVWCRKLRPCWPRRRSAVTPAVFSQRHGKSVSHWNKGNSLKIRRERCAVTILAE